MKQKRSIFALSSLSLAFLIGCNGGGTKVDDLTKFKTTADAAIKEVDTLNETIGNKLPTFKEESSSKNSSKNAGVEYYDSDDYRYCEEQAFTNYIFNNIYYSLHNFYDNNDVKIGDVISGLTEIEHLPDIGMQIVYTAKELDRPRLSAKCSLNSNTNEDNYIVDFEADWDFRNSALEDPMYKDVNSVIMTTGRINYSKKNNKLVDINLNYYFTKDNRDFGSFNLDYENNKFYCFVLSGGASDWSAQDVELYNLWNEGKLDTTALRKLHYGFMYVFKGNITTDLESLELKSKYRYMENYVEESEGIEGRKDFDDLFTEIYSKNKDVKVRGDNDAIDLTNKKEVNIDNCARYGEAKTRIYWIRDTEENETEKYKRSVMPYQSKDNLVKYFTDLKTKDVNEKQKTLLDNAISYLNNLSESEYFGEFEVKDSISYSYNGSDEGVSAKDYRYNVYTVDSLQYELKDNETSVKFIIDNNEVKLNEFFK